MKKNLFFLLSLITFTFTACDSSEEFASDNGKNAIPEEVATLNIDLIGQSNGSPESRADDSEGTDESKVNNGIIYVFDADNNVIKKAFFTTSEFNTSPKTKTITTTTAAKSVSVLLNVGVTDSASLAGKPYDVPTKAKLESLVVDLAATTGTGASTQTNNNLYMSGKSTATITFSGSPLTATVPVTVSRIASKVKINWVLQPSSTYTGKIKLTGAVILNARSNSKLFGTSLYPTSGSKYIQGLSNLVLTNFPASTGYKPADADIISNVNVFSVSQFSENQEDKTNHFYIFENAATYPTIVAIQADYNENGIGGSGTTYQKYYPVIINKTLTGGQNGLMTIERNNQYVITATIKGVGVDNPFEPLDPASLNVVVTVAPWNVAINVNQTFE